MGEFGRAPRVALERTLRRGDVRAASTGRRFTRSCWPGAGVARGGVVGASDRIGAYPSTQPVGPGDVAATLFAALGIDPAGHFTDPSGRPHTIATGRPIRAFTAERVTALPILLVMRGAGC